MNIRSSAAAAALSSLLLTWTQGTVRVGAAPTDLCDVPAKAANFNFTLKDAGGRNVSLASFKGHVVVLNLWATWCAPCKVEIPGLVDLQRLYAGEGLQVVGVAVDDPVDKLKSFMADYKINYPVLQGRNRDDILDAYAPVPAVVPATIVIGRDGNICRKHRGAAARETLEQEIRSLL